MTSLIDVIFLLLLFFMLSSTFTRFGEIELTAAGTGAQRALAPVYVRLDGDHISLNGDKIELGDLVDALKDQAQAGANTIMLKLDEATVSQRFIDVYAVLRATPGLSVAVLR